MTSPILAPTNKWWSLVVVTIILLATTASSLTTTFRTNRQSSFLITPGSKLSTTNLMASLSTPTGTNFTKFEDDDSGKKKETVKAPRQNIPAGTTSICIQRMEDIEYDDDFKEDFNPNFNEFHQYLRGIASKVKNGRTRAHLMDDELKRLETKYYKLTSDDIPECRFEPNKYTFTGPTFQPDEKCYAMVINSYSKAGLGKMGAMLAEAAAERFEKHHPGRQANAYLVRGIVLSWVNAGDLLRAKDWLSRMEDRYETSRRGDDALDAKVYTEFLNALSTSKADEKHAGDSSMRVLLKMRDAYWRHGNAKVIPTVETYTAVMRCQERSYRGIQGVHRMSEVLRLLVQDYEAVGRLDSCKMTASAVLPVIQAATSIRGSLESISVAERTLQDLQRRYDETQDTDFLPLEQMYTLLLAAYAKVSASHAVQYSSKVDEILATMEKYGIAKSIYTITAAVRAKANDRSDESMKQAEQLMRTVPNPDEKLYQSLLKGYSRNGNPEKVEQILAEMGASVGVDVMAYAMCINTWSKNCCDDNMERAIQRTEVLLEKIVDMYRKGDVSSNHAPVDTWVLEDAARVWLKSRRPEAGVKVTEIIEAQELLHEMAPAYFQPSETLFLLAFDILSRPGVEAGEKALHLLDMFEQLSMDGLFRSPNVRMCSSIIGALASSSKQEKASDKACEVYEKLLQKVEKGATTTPISPMILSILFRTILRPHSKNIGEVAMTVLRRTVDVAKLQPSLILLNKQVFSNLLKGLSRKHLHDETRETLDIMSNLAKDGFDTNPDANAYMIIASSIARRKRPSTLEEAKNLQAELLQLYKDGKLEADILLWNPILEAYKTVAHSCEEASHSAYDLLMQLEEFGQSDKRVLPNLSSYRAVCEAFSKSSAPNSSALSVDVFLRAKTLAQEGRIDDLDRNIYFAVISAHAKDSDENGLERAGLLLEEMRNSGKDYLVPDQRTYNRMLSAYAHSNDVNKAAHAAAIFRLMRNDYEAGNEKCKPSIHSYNSVILSAAYSDSHPIQPTRNIFDVALQIFKALQMQDDLPAPNSCTYEFFIRACLNLLPTGDAQTKLIGQTFSLCRNKQLVTRHVVGLSHCYIPGVQESLELPQLLSFTTMGDRQTHGNQPTAKGNMFLIPEEWCARVPENKRKREVILGECRLRSEFIPK